MRLYRICPEQFLENYSGLGASYQDGARWNSKGHAVLYFTLSPATAMLEMANYLPSPRLVPADYRLGIYEIPDTIKTDELSADQLPGDWAVYPYPRSTQQLGDKWLSDGNAFVLLVPSTAVSRGLEKIAVINPAHPACKKIHLVEAVSELYNQRSFSGI
jgi:RES domain-containing protein